MAFRQGDRLVGLEVDLATHLAHDLGRELRFVDIDFDNLIPALLDDRIDVVMSGLTVTRARQFRVAFADPYLDSGLVALMRRGDRSRYQRVEQVLATTGRVGVRKASTGEKFVQERMPNATIVPYSTSGAAGIELPQHRIDLFVNDAPIVAWLVSSNEADLAALWTLLTHDEIAWAFRPGDEALRGAANETLARWRADGTLRQILGHWLRGWPGQS